MSLPGSALAGRWRSRDWSWVAALLTGLAVLGIYRTTLLPGVSLWDTAEAQTVPALMGTMHPTGFPAFVLLGWLASAILQPLGDPAFRANLLSAILAATAAGTGVLVLRRLEVPLLVAVAAAIGIALAPVAWHISAAADVHALHLALLALAVLTLLRWAALVADRGAAPGDAIAARRADRGLVLAAAVFGVALANHGLTILLIPPVGLYVLAVDPAALRRPRLVATALAACLCVAAVLYLELPLRAGPFRSPIVYGHPETWGGFWEVVLASQFQGGLLGLLADPAGKVVALGRLAGDQLGVLALLVPAGFLATAVRLRAYALLSGVAVLLTCLFAMSYDNAAIDRYYLGPLFFAWTWLAVLAATGIDLTVSRLAPGSARGRRGRIVRAVTVAAIALVLLVPTGVALGPRWREADRSGDTAMAGWLDDAFAAFERDAVVLSWWSYSTPLWYGQLIEGRRPDVLVLDDRTLLDEGLGTIEDVIEANLGRRPVYVIRAQASDVQALGLRYVIEPVDRLEGMYRVTGRQENQQ